MEYAYKIKLIDWGLEDYYQSFLEEGITDESFELLDDETIKLILRKSGPRLIFKSKFINYKNSCVMNFETASTASTDTISTSNCEPGGSGSSRCSYEFIPDEELRAIIIPAKTTDESTTATVDVSPNKLTKLDDSIFAPSGGLENVLRKSAEGRIVLANRKKLNNDHRQKLTKIIVNELISLNGENEAGNYKYNIKGDTFRKAAEEITQLFPGETIESYYIPYMSPKPGLRKQPARGKLWSRYVNVRASLRFVTENTNSDSKVDETDRLCSCENELLFLKSEVEPYPKILQCWEATQSERAKKYKTCDIDKIFNEFPCLRQNFGLELLESDFNQLFPDKIDIIYSEWPRVSQAILEEIKERKITLDELGPDIDTSTQALLALPFLFSPITLKKNSSKTGGGWRPTRSEVRESFFFNIQSFSEINEILERRRQTLQKYQFPLQPFGFSVGQLTDIEHCYIFINNVFYKCDTSIRCLELLYKAFHALNLEYSYECKHIWLFIQELVFKFPTTSKLSVTASVLSDINYHLSKST